MVARQEDAPREEEPRRKKRKVAVAPTAVDGGADVQAECAATENDVSRAADDALRVAEDVARAANEALRAAEDA